MLNDIILNLRSYYHGFIDLLPKLALAILVMLALIGLARVLRNFSHKRLDTRMDDPLLARFIANILGMVIIIVALLLALRIVGLGGVAVGLLSTAGVSAFVIGFAFKDIGENFLAGIVLAFSRPFRIGDTVELSGFTGKVTSLNLRDTQIKSSDGKDIFIPNSIVVKSPVVNRTLDEFLRSEFEIRLNYSADIGKAASLIQQALDSSQEILHDAGKMPEVVYGDMSPTNISLVARYWLGLLTTKTPPATVKKLLFDRVKTALNNGGINLPYDLSEVTAQRANNQN